MLARARRLIRPHPVRLGRCQPARQRLPQLRFLATVVPAPQSAPKDADEIYHNDEFLPFEGLPSSFNAQRFPIPLLPGAQALRGVHEFDTSSVVKLDQGLITQPLKQSRKHGFAGNLNDLSLALHACIKVERFERARSLLKAMLRLLPPSAPEVLSHHNQYLTALIQHAIRHPGESLKALPKWFEVDMIGAGIRPNARTYALMLKASMQVNQPAKMERTIRRYMRMATIAGCEQELLSLDVLSDYEISVITRLSPLNWNLADRMELATSQFEHEIAAENDPNSAVLPQEQKGVGLALLKESLSLFGNSKLPITSEMEGVIDEDSPAYQYLRQKRLEEDTVTAAMERWRYDTAFAEQYTGVSAAMHQPKVNGMLWQWNQALAKYVTEELERVEASEALSPSQRTPDDQERVLHGPFLRLIDPERLAAVTILAVMNNLCSIGIEDGLAVSFGVLKIGSAVHDELSAEAFKNSNKKLWKNVKGRERRRMIRYARTKPIAERDSTIPEEVKALDTEHEPKFNDMKEWTVGVRAKVGGILLKGLLETAKVEHPTEDADGNIDILSQPALYRTSKYANARRHGWILPNPVVSEMLRREPIRGATAKFLPMLVSPKKWIDFREGGYLNYKEPVVRVKSREQKDYIVAACERGDMKQIFAGLDVLGKTAWRVNEPILDVMVQAWNKGEALADIPPENPKTEYPPQPSDDDRLAHRRWVYEKEAIDNTVKGLHSQRCFQNLQLEVANSLRKETFYFPHSLDYRGRAYPVPPYFNHMQADNARGLLVFANGKELGAKGLSWLKIHLSNVYGFDKASFAEREQFTMDRLDDVYDSAMNPLDGKRWWLKAEDPWQCLAACMELRNALESPDPTSYKSHLAIHQDGTCNGLQHYAALGGDILGAKQVNLEPSDRPQDVYSAVAELVKAAISQDAANGDERAIFLQGKITRKVVKQTVMTNVYGVTFIGAKDQVKKQLHDMLPELAYPELELYSKFIATKIFAALAKIFNGAHDIQMWLGECASRISTCITPQQVDAIKAFVEKQKHLPSSARVKNLLLPEEYRFMSSVIWTTPLKMPVVQPYRSSKATEISTLLQDVSIKEPNATDPTNKRKQLQGFPPNFIHSLDATHMILSALECNDAGLTFSAVHDSFWTHAADVAQMNFILRDAFIRLHSENVIQRLAEEFKERYKNGLYLASVDRNSVLGRKIDKHRRQAMYEKRKAKKGWTAPTTSIEELLAEQERQRLLSSSKPEEVARGKAMVTPASLYKAAAPEDFKSATSTEPSQEIADAALTLGAQGAAVKGLEHEAGSTSTNAPALSSQIPEVDEDDLASAIESEGLSEDNGASSTETAKKAKKAAKPAVPKCHVWLPLEFPAIPARGEFDVARVRDSEYFFS